MSSSIGLSASIIFMIAAVFVNTLLFRIARAKPNSALVKGELASSMTAIFITTMIIMSLAWFGSAFQAVAGNIIVSMVVSVVAFVATSVVAWHLLGVGKAGLPRGVSGAPHAA